MESFCEMGEDPHESLFHVFFHCPVEKMFWDKVKKLSGVMVPNLHPCSWATNVLQVDVCSSTTTAMIVYGAWTLWTKRYIHCHGHKV